MYRMKISCTDRDLFRQRRINTLHHEAVPFISVFLDLYPGFQEKSIFCKAVPYCVKCSFGLKASENQITMFPFKFLVRKACGLELVGRTLQGFH